MYRYVLLIVKSVCAVLAGALLIADPQAYITLMVQIIGGVFLLAGLVPVISFWFPSAAGTIGGLIMSVIGVFVFLPVLTLKKRSFYTSAHKS